MSGNNEWLEYNLKPLLNTVISLLASLGANMGNILAEGELASSVVGDNDIVSLTNTESASIFVSAAIGTSNDTGSWKFELPDGVGTKTIIKRTSHQAPNVVYQFVPTPFLLAVGETVTLKQVHTKTGKTAKGFIIAYKTS